MIMKKTIIAQNILDLKSSLSSSEVSNKKNFKDKFSWEIDVERYFDYLEDLFKKLKNRESIDSKDIDEALCCTYDEVLEYADLQLKFIKRHAGLLSALYRFDKELLDEAMKHMDEERTVYVKPNVFQSFLQHLSWYLRVRMMKLLTPMKLEERVYKKFMDDVCSRIGRSTIEESRKMFMDEADRTLKRFRSNNV